MRKQLTVLVLVFAASVAFAGDFYKQTLTPTTGTSQSATIARGAKLLVRCTVGACYKTCLAGATCTLADCSQATDLEAAEKWPVPLASNEDTIAILGRDGTTSCKLFVSTP